MRQGAQGWCTGMTLRDGMGREVGGGFRMGSTCTPMTDSCQCMEKPLQYCKVISLQLKYINKILKKRIHLPMQGTQFRSLVWEEPTCLRATKPVCHNWSPCAPGPTGCNYWAHMMQLLSTGSRLAHPEPSLCNKRRPCDKPVLHTEEQWPLTTTRESLRTALKTQCNQNVINIINKIKNKNFSSKDTITKE